MSGVTNTTTTYEVVCCGECGVQFAMTTEFRQARMNDHKVFWCPNGHRRYYSGENKEEELRRKLDQQSASFERERQSHQRTERSRKLLARQRAAAKGQVTKMRNRIANGICPCCNRTFKNVARHMQSQHPDYVDQKP
jgi:hypothetical protein